MSRFGFTCSYTRLGDVDGVARCGRRATRRPKGEPKCLGHWAVEHLVDLTGGTEHARRTWGITAVVLLYLGVSYATSVWSRMPLLLIACACSAFSAGLALGLLREAPLGGLVCLVSAPLIAFSFMQGQLNTIRYYLGATARAPAHSSRTVELAGAFVSIEIGLAFTVSWSGFVLLYTMDDHAWMRFCRRLSRLLGVTASAGVVFIAVASRGRSTALLPWVVVVVVASLVAGGTGRLKRLAKHLRV